MQNYLYNIKEGTTIRNSFRLFVCLFSRGIRTQEKEGSVSIVSMKMELCRFLLKSAFLMLTFTRTSSGQATAICDNCYQKENHKEIDNSRHSVLSEWKSGQEPLCDADLQPGWYRFTSFVGGQMPTSKVNINHCGTNSPVWLDGTTGNHPGPNDAVVRIKACAHVLERNNGCFVSFYVSVKNRGGAYYLYYL